MLHFSFQINSAFNLTKTLLLICSLVFSISADLKAADTELNRILAISGKDTGSHLEIRIKGSAPLTNTVYELYKPSRIIVDIAEAGLSPDLRPQLPDNSPIKLSASEIKDATPPVARLEFSLPQSHPYTALQDNNDIVLSINLTKKTTDDAASTGQTSSPSASSATSLDDIEILTTPDKTTVSLIGNGKISGYTYDAIKKSGDAPARLYLDLNNISGDSLPKEQDVGTSLAKIRVAKRGSGLRIVFDSALDDVFPFTLQSTDKGLELLIDESGKKDQVKALIKEKKGIDSQLPEVNPLDAKLSPQAAEVQMQDAFNFSGYNKERITVDFYKIDLHNVFRLLREVSGVNMVVDEAVTGSLTLALNDVPWDFALDIILNLKDLAKEERFNTLVIVPKDKQFNWPKQAENNLSFEADATVAEKDAILIKQQEMVPKEIAEAKELILKGKQAEKAENFESAVELYETALGKWPGNTKLANTLASLYLVQLRQNAKAVYFAKKALESDAKNNAAALNAAIASANMLNFKEAQDYFSQSVSTDTPSSEALLSYAAFGEQQQKYDEAIKILERHTKLYGDNLNSMLAKARLFDKKGDQQKATTTYKAILLSGYPVPPDLAKYIKGRVALKPAM